MILHDLKCPALSGHYTDGPSGVDGPTSSSRTLTLARAQSRFLRRFRVRLHSLGH